MALLSEAYKEKKFDNRLVRRSISSGAVTQEEISKNEKTLSDDSENATYTNLDELFEGLNSRKTGLR